MFFLQTSTYKSSLDRSISTYPFKFTLVIESLWSLTVLYQTIIAKFESVFVPSLSLSLPLYYFKLSNNHQSRNIKYQRNE